MFSGEGTGLLRLHSTYRHDLKIYSSDEGRVQVSTVALAFFFFSISIFKQSCLEVIIFLSMPLSILYVLVLLQLL